MKCAAVSTQISAWLDGQLAPARGRELRRHLDECPACRRHADQLRATIHCLHEAAAPAPPPELSWRLRVLASRLAAGQHPPNGWDGWRLRWQNWARAMAMPAFAGMMGALTLAALLVGTVGVPLPATWPANPQAAPAIFIPPQILTTPGLNLQGTLIVAADITPGGRVSEYRLLSGPRNRQTLSRLRQEMHSTVFRPALLAGHPIRGQALLSFSNYRVRG